MDFLIDVANAVLDASGLKEKAGRSELVIRLKQRFGIADIESLTTSLRMYMPMRWWSMPLMRKGCASIGHWWRFLS
ncbi:MAG: hypothetical protein AAGC93_25155 [Cyanobacteria bacterium P01_F01_bin.53]